MPIDAVLPQKKPKNICAEDFRGEFLLWLSGNPSEPAYGWAQTIDSMFSSPSLPAPILKYFRIYTNSAHSKCQNLANLVQT